MSDASFEDNLKELENIVNKLESGDIALGDAIDKFNQAMKLVKQCNDKLNEAEKAIVKIVNENGEIEDFDI